MLYRVHQTGAGFELTTLVVIGTDCTGTEVVEIQLPYDHDHDGPHKFMKEIDLSNSEVPVLLI